MIINKTFDIILNIININDLFNKDINNTILNLVKKKYVDKCFLGVYILDINRILNRSLIESNQSSLNGSFNLFIQFEGKCITYGPNEIIFNMEVKDTINNIISCMDSKTSAIIKLNNKTENKNENIFEKGHLIPIIVGKSKFITGSSTIQINAYPFIPIIDNKKIYYKIDDLSEDTLNKLNEFINENIAIEEEKKQSILKNANNKWEYFKEFLYPLKVNNTDKIIKAGEYIDLLELSKLKNKLIYLNNEVDLSKRLINVNNIDDKSNDITEYIKEDEYIVLYDVLKKYYLYLYSINQLATIYDTDDKIKKNKNIFDLYIKYKK